MLRHTALLFLLVASFHACLPVVTSAEEVAPKEQPVDQPEAQPADQQHFDKVVAPLLAARCLSCHGSSKPEAGLNLSQSESALAGGESGKAIEPGNVEKSLLVQRVLADEMPPEHPLSADEKKVLTQWISAGARWGSGPIDPFRFSTDKRAGYDWWSLQPVTDPPLPPNQQTHWPKNGIDHFVLARLAAAGLKPNPAADPRTQVRRLYYDLIGLPPDPEVVARFVSDPTDAAYEKLVDDLLASPRYGERWGRHWLDVARYGESDGFERNNPRKNAWPYRDWVIQALNDDMPYDQFVRMQIAGDILTGGQGEGVAAVGFLTAGVHNTVVGSSERMKRLARQDELEEIAAAVSQGFLGLTINCARCHDHKFDPVKTEEYYRFIAALDGVTHGQRNVSFVKNADELADLSRQLELLQKEVASLDAIGRAKVLADRQDQQEDAPPSVPEAFARWEFDNDLQDSVGKLHGTAHGEARLEGGALVLDGNSYVSTEGLSSNLSAKTLEAWVLLDDLNQRGGGVISVETTDGNTFDAIVFGEREPQRWMAGSNFFRRTQSFQGPAEETAHKEPVHIAIVYDSDDTITGYRNGQVYGQSYKTGTAEFKPGAHLVFGMRHAPAGANKMLKGRILRANLYDRALSAEAVAASAGVKSDFVAEKEILAALTQTQRANREQAAKKLAEVQTKVAALTSVQKLDVYTVVPKNPGEMRVHIRGSVTDYGDVVQPGGVSSVVKSVEGSADFGLGETAPDDQRRRKLAEWITAADNPLFGRTMVNRVWHHHFGAGIVQTPSDLGFGGGHPSHPQLLDWLTSRFAENEFRLKPLHKLIVTSSTYRQASTASEAAKAKDGSNRLLWRHSPTRVDAEVLRDAMLKVSGSLNAPAEMAVGGPGFEDVSITVNNGTTYYEPIPRAGSEYDRRTVYRFSPRGGRSALLDTFDCPDPSTATPRRNVTTTPLQALSLLNNEFVLRMADRFAERVTTAAAPEVATDGEASVDQQVELVWEFAVGRKPDAEERRLSQTLVEKHGLSALCRAMFNVNEFVVIE